MPPKPLLAKQFIGLRYTLHQPIYGEISAPFSCCLLAQKRASLRTPFSGKRFYPGSLHPSDEILPLGTPDYCNSFITSCCTVFACASAAMPVWLRISYLDILEVADA